MINRRTKGKDTDEEEKVYYNVLKFVTKIYEQ